MTYTCPRCNGKCMEKQGKITILCKRCGGRGLVSTPGR